MDLAAEGITKDLKGQPLEIGKGVVRREGTDVCLLAYGSAVNEALAAAEILSNGGVSATVIDARFCKPLDTALIRSAAKNHAVMLSIEEGAIGGFAAHVMQVRGPTAASGKCPVAYLPSFPMGAWPQQGTAEYYKPEVVSPVWMPMTLTNQKATILPPASPSSTS